MVHISFGQKYKVYWNYYRNPLYRKDFNDILNIFELEPIMRCIIHDDAKYLKDIISSTLDFNFNKKVFSRSLIENCCFCGSVECFKFLRSNGVEITKKCFDYSINGRSQFIINEYLQYFKPDKHTMLEAIKTHNFDIATSFEQMYGVEIPIDSVCLYFDVKLFLYLMSTSTKFDLLLKACFSFKIPDLFDDVLSLNSNIEAFNVLEALLSAVHKNNISIVTKLFERGANIDSADYFGATPLMIAVKEHRVEVLAKLIELGANIEAKDKNGETALFLAAYYHYYDILEKLINAGADINAKDKSGFTPLHIAVYMNDFNDIPKLISFGADIEAKDSNGRTPLFLSIDRGYIASLEKLITFGANIETRDNSGRTALELASAKNKAETVKKLSELGATIH